MSDDTPIPGFDLAAYLDGLRWSSDATEHEKTLVIGNLRALHAAIARALPTVQELQRMVLERNKVIDEETRLRIDAESAATRLRGLCWYAWREFNAIRARDGAPDNVSHAYWDELTEHLRAAIGDEDAKPWPSEAANRIEFPSSSGTTPTGEDR